METKEMTQTEFERQLLVKNNCEWIFPLIDNEGRTQFILSDNDDLLLEGSIGFTKNKKSFSDNVHLCIFRNSEYNNIEEITKEQLKEIINQYIFWIEGERGIGNNANTVTIYTNLVINEHSSTIRNFEKDNGLIVKRVSAPYF